VQTDSEPPKVAADDFARRFSMRGGSLMWFLGAGSAAAAGIPTAWDMIWEFKQQLYASQRRVSSKIVADLANPAVQRELQAFIDGLDRFPAAGAPDEYAALFEAIPTRAIAVLTWTASCAARSLPMATSHLPRS
jgi:hypothetical protein